MRIYDSRLGRFLSVDPLTKSYPFYTPFQFSGNTPISCIDLDGLEAISVTIRTNADDPALKQVTLTKLKSKVEQASLAVTYKYIDQNGRVTSVYTTDSYAQGSIEAKLANLNFRGGPYKMIDVLTAGIYEGETFVPEAIQDPESVFSGGTCILKSFGGFQYDLNIQYKPDGYNINEADLKPGTLDDAKAQIEKAKTTLSGNVNATSPTGETFPANVSSLDITVSGETDGMPSNHPASTQPNNQPQGNPALAQDRANVLKAALGNMNGRTIGTQTINHTGSNNQQNRTAKILAVPSN